MYFLYSKFKLKFQQFFEKKLVKNLLIFFFKKRPTLGLYSKVFINYNNLSLDAKKWGVTVKGLKVTKLWTFDSNNVY